MELPNYGAHSYTKREYPYLPSVWVRSDVHTKLSGKGRSDGRNSIIYTLCVISLRKNLNRLSSRDKIGLD
jgi:hypothetical protein